VSAVLSIPKPGIGDKADTNIRIHNTVQWTAFREDEWRGGYSALMVALRKTILEGCIKHSTWYTS
jgi:hypothetical protein